MRIGDLKENYCERRTVCATQKRLFLLMELQHMKPFVHHSCCFLSPGGLHSPLFSMLETTTLTSSLDRFYVFITELFVHPYVFYSMLLLPPSYMLCPCALFYRYSFTCLLFYQTVSFFKSKSIFLWSVCIWVNNPHSLHNR